MTGCHNLIAMKATFGDLSKIENSEHDVFYLAKKLADEGGPLPKFFTSIGTKDPHWEENIRFRKVLLENGYDVYWEQGPYIHDWTNWNHYIERHWNGRQSSGPE